MTLVEVATSAVSAAILFAGLASAMSFALRAADPSVGPYQKAYDGARSSFQLTRELQCATAFNSTVSNATRVEFTVPDQDGDGQADTIRYSWSGQSGAPLQRIFNGGTAQDVVPNVYSFQLRYRTKTVPPPVVPTESSETQFLDQSSSNSGFLSSMYNVATDSWFGEYFKPTLPANAVSWRITRVQLYLDGVSSTDGTALVQVRSADEGVPSKDVTGQAVLSEADFPNNWYTVSFSNASGLPPSLGACILVAYAAGSDNVVQVKQGIWSTSTSGTYAIYTGDNGATWSNTSWVDMWVRVWGTYTTNAAGTGASQYFRTGVDVTLQVGPDSKTAVTASVQTVNQPQVTSP